MRVGGTMRWPVRLQHHPGLYITGPGKDLGFFQKRWEATGAKLRSNMVCAC